MSNTYENNYSNQNTLFTTHSIMSWKHRFHVKMMTRHRSSNIFIYSYIYIYHEHDVYIIFKGLNINLFYPLLHHTHAPKAITQSIRYCYFRRHTNIHTEGNKVTQVSLLSLLVDIVMIILLLFRSSSSMF